MFSLVAVLSALAFTGCGLDEGQGELNGMTRQPQTEVGKVSLPNVNPESSNQKGVLRGSGDGLMLVYFGYTDCPDVCPTTLADLRLALELAQATQDTAQRRSPLRASPRRYAWPVCHLGSSSECRAASES